MSSRRHGLAMVRAPLAPWLVCLLAGLLATPPAVRAQDEEPQRTEGGQAQTETERDAESFDAERFDTEGFEAEGARTEAAGERGGAAAEGADIDDILAQDEDVLYGNQATYDPGARRDPFRSLLQREQQEEVTSARPEGIPGLLIDEVELEGVFMTADGPVAQIQAASDETSYLLRPGDQLWDGDVVSISLDTITFKQSINDPTALKPFREVVKKLNP